MDPIRKRLQLILYYHDLIEKIIHVVYCQVTTERIYSQDISLITLKRKHSRFS